MLTSPGFLLKSNSGEFLGILTKYPATMVFYMGLKSIDRLVARLKESHPANLPIAVVYYAGYPEREKVVKGTLDTILDKIKEAKEEWMGMIIVGRCLKGKPYRSRLGKIGK